MNCIKFELNLAFIQHIYEFLFFLHLIAFILSHISMLNQISYFPSESFVKRGLDTKIIDVLFLFFFISMAIIEFQMVEIQFYSYKKTFNIITKQFSKQA